MAKLMVLVVLLSLFGLTYATYTFKLPYGYSGKSKGVIGAYGGKGIGGYSSAGYGAKGFGGFGLAGYGGKGFGLYPSGGKGLGGYGGFGAGGFGGGGINQIFIPLIFLIIILPLITNLFNNK